MTRALGRGIDAIFKDDPIASMQKENERLSKEIEEVKRELALHRRNTEAMSAKDMYEGAKAAKETNPAVWAYIVRKAQWHVDNSKTFSLWKIIEELRESENIIVVDGDRYKFNSSFTSTWLRFLFLEIPELKKITRYRSCKTDKYFGDLNG